MGSPLSPPTPVRARKVPVLFVFSPYLVSLTTVLGVWHLASELVHNVVHISPLCVAVASGVVPERGDHHPFHGAGDQAAAGR